MFVKHANNQLDSVLPAAFVDADNRQGVDDELEKLKKEILFLKKQIICRDRLLSEAKEKLDTFFPSEPLPSSIPPNCKMKTRRGSWKFVDKTTKKTVKIRDNIKKLKKF